MFPSEVIVRITDTDGKAFSALADRSLVVERDHAYFIRATRLENDPKTGVSVCLLPVDISESGSRWIRVPSGTIQQAA
jgi:hypothetical protein